MMTVTVPREPMAALKLEYLFTLRVCCINKSWAKTFKVLKSDFVLLWLLNHFWGTTSIPSHVLLIHLHPQKLGQSHRALTIHLSFVLMELLFFLVLYLCTNAQRSTFCNKNCLFGGGDKAAKNELKSLSMWLDVCAVQKYIFYQFVCTCSFGHNNDPKTPLSNNERLPLYKCHQAST